MRTPAMPTIIAESPSMQQVLDLARRFAGESVPVLLVGATGTGKELVAQYIHCHSGRAGPLIDLDCGVVSRELAESMLFGHRRGAFTGATDHAIGLIAAAADGTLFLDELCSLTLELQAKLLRVLETKEVRPIGGVAKTHIDFRLVATAQTDLDTRVDTGQFRLDLYQRICGARIEIPLLCERPADIVPLAQHFAARCGRALHADADAVLLDLPRFNGHEVYAACRCSSSSCSYCTGLT